MSFIYEGNYAVSKITGEEFNMSGLARIGADWFNAWMKRPRFQFNSAINRYRAALLQVGLIHSVQETVPDNPWRGVFFYPGMVRP